MKHIVELWTPVLLNDGIFKDDYIVSNMGRVKKKRTYSNGASQFIIVKAIKGKRPVVEMTGNGKQYRKSIAKLVLSSFHYREGCECANITYLDGDMTNCRLSNLRYTADNGVCTEAELDKAVNKKPVASSNKKPKRAVVIKSCRTCKNNPCFSGMETLTSDFGAEGCRKYKPREDLSNNNNN